MTDSRPGLALLAGEVVVLTLALAVVATSPNVDPIPVFDVAIPPGTLGGAIVAAGGALGALRTTATAGYRHAFGELGIAVALATAIAVGANPLALALATAIAIASITLRVDPTHIQRVLGQPTR